MFFKFKKILKKLIKYMPTMVFCLCSICSLLLMSQTSSTKVESWSNKFNNYFFNNDISLNESPFIRIESDDKKTLMDLFMSYYYTNSSTVNSSFRHIYSGDSSFGSANGSQYKTVISKQDMFTIGQKYSWGYYLEYGLFATYYKDEILPDRGYLHRRFGADGFCFISDSLADKLLVEYGIDNTQKDENGIPLGYRELITNKKYALLELFIDSETTNTKLCINNILYSNTRTGPRVKELYGDFCVAYGDRITMNQLSYCAEFDMKSDVYGTSTFIKSANAMGYNRDNSEYSIFKYDKDSKKYIRDVALENELQNIDFKRNETIFYSIPSILVLTFIPFIFYMKKQLMVNFLISTSIFLLYNIVLLFAFVPPTMNIFVVAYYVLLFVILIIRIIKEGYFAKHILEDKGINYEELSV